MQRKIALLWMLLIVTAIIVLATPVEAAPYTPQNYWNQLEEDDPEMVLEMLTRLGQSLIHTHDLENSKRGLDLGLSRGFSGSQAAKHLMGLAAANYAGGPGRRRRSQQACKIPPILNNLTASNISLDQERDINGLESCNYLPYLSSASHGVKSKPLEEELYPSTSMEKIFGKVETIPLLSPTMELELLKEEWMSCTKPCVSTGEDSTVSFWEENFQDLSSWCIDFSNSFQDSCNYPIGESMTLKLSDVKNDDNNVSTTEDGKLKELMEIDDEKWSLGNNDAVINLLDENIQSIQQPQQECSSISDISTAWLNLPTTASTDNTYSASVSSANSQDTIWASLCSLDTDKLNAVNLLQYSCDETTNSSCKDATKDLIEILEENETLKSSTVARNNVAEVEGKRKSNGVKRKSKFHTTSMSTTETSRSLEMSGDTSETSRGINATVTMNVGEKNSKKRKKVETYLYSDADVQMSDHNYRESRERNNEASRKSRMNKKAKDTEMIEKAMELEKDNRMLKMKVAKMEKLVTLMRTTLLRSALKK